MCIRDSPIYGPNSIIIGAWTLGVLHHANKFYSNRHISSHINSDQKTAKQPPKTQYLGLPNFQVCGLLYPCAFSDEGKIWHKRKRERERHPRSTLPRQISPWSMISKYRGVSIKGFKTANLNYFANIEGLLYPPYLTDQDRIWYAQFYTYMPNFIVYSVACRGENLHMLRIFDFVINSMVTPPSV